MGIAIKPSPAANIRRPAETGLDAQDINVLTGYSAAEIKRLCRPSAPWPNEYDAQPTEAGCRAAQAFGRGRPGTRLQMSRLSPRHGVPGVGRGRHLGTRDAGL